MKKLLFLFYSATAGAVQTYTVCASGCTYTNLQTAITAAKDYQELTSCVEVVLSIRAGETFTGNFTLPAKTCARYIFLDSSSLSALPNGMRVSPSDAGNMPTLIPSNNSINSTIATVQASGTGYWQLRGLNISSPLTMVDPNYQFSLIGLPEDSTTEVQSNLTPHHIVIDRSYIHGIATVEGPARCIGAHGRNIQITNNYLDDCKVRSSASDSQGIFIQNGFGPYYIYNNRIQAAGENILIGQGGNSSAIKWLTQRWIDVKGNYFTKKIAWKYSEAAGGPSWTPCLDTEKYKNTSTNQWYECTANVWNTIATQLQYGVKNFYEHKEGQNATVFGNVAINNWPNPGGQTGPHVLLNQSEGIHLNIRGLQITSNWWQTGQIALAMGYFGTSDKTFTGQVYFNNNLITDIGSALYGTNGGTGGSNTYALKPEVYQRDIFFEHNTMVTPVSGTSYMNNITKSTQAAGQQYGILAINNNALFPGQFLFNRDGYASNGWCSLITAQINSGELQLSNNLIIGSSGSYSTNNSPGCPPYADFPTSVIFGVDYATTFTNAGANDWTMKVAGPGINSASDGSNTGVEFGTFNAAIAGAVSGTNNTYLRAGFRRIATTITSVSINYTAPSGTACTISASVDKSFAATVGTPSVSQTGVEGTASITGLTNNTNYWIRLLCSGLPVYTQIITR